MRVGIFYMSKQDGPDRQPIKLPGGGRIYIRVEEANVKTLGNGLDRAPRRPFENLMNSHSLPEIDS